jgi:hypothetical protein
LIKLWEYFQNLPLILLLVFLILFLPLFQVTCLYLIRNYRHWHSIKNNFNNQYIFVSIGIWWFITKIPDRRCRCSFITRKMPLLFQWLFHSIFLCFIYSELNFWIFALFVGTGTILVTIFNLIKGYALLCVCIFSKKSGHVFHLICR